MTEETEENEEFWDKVGEDTDPVAYFVKKVKECGAEVTTDGNKYSVRGGCGNLQFHEAGDFKEIFCEECGVSISVLHLFDNNGDEAVEKTNEKSDSDEENSQELDEIDEFLDAVNGSSGYSGSNFYDNYGFDDGDEAECDESDEDY